MLFHYSILLFLQQTRVTKCRKCKLHAYISQILVIEYSKKKKTQILEYILFSVSYKIDETRMCFNQNMS